MCVWLCEIVWTLDNVIIYLNHFTTWLHWDDRKMFLLYISVLYNC